MPVEGESPGVAGGFADGPGVEARRLLKVLAARPVFRLGSVLVAAAVEVEAAAGVETDGATAAETTRLPLLLPGEAPALFLPLRGVSFFGPAALGVLGNDPSAFGFGAKRPPLVRA